MAVERRAHRVAGIALGAIIAILEILASAGVASAAPDGLALADRLGTSEPRALEAAIAAIEHAPADTPELAGALFAAARACEDRLADPARALALYDRILRELPDARVAMSARRRADALHAQLGGGGEFAVQAAALARLLADANELPVDELVRRGDALAVADWPGAGDAALWLAEWLRRAGRFDEAQVRYASVTARWPGTPRANTALRGGAGCALDAHDWGLAEQLAAQLPATAEADRVLRDDLLEAAARGRRFARGYVLAWLAVIGVLATLVGSLVEAARRGGWKRPPLRPPTEVMFLAPVSAVLIGVAFTAHRMIAPAVSVLALGGVVLAWLSGSALDLARDRGRPVRARALVHVVACVIGVAALAYIVLTRDSLLELVIETVRFGPEP